MARKKKAEAKYEKKYFALNTQLLFCAFMVVIGLFLGIVGIACDEGDGSGILIGILGFGLFGVFSACMLLMPVGFLFSSRCVTILYVLGYRETVLWQSVSSVVRYGSWFSRYEGLPHYKLNYFDNRKKPFYVKGEISETLRTKRLMKRFYRRDIL